MIKQIMDSIIIFLIALAGFTHFLRILYLIFKPGILKRISFISNPIPGKISLLLYYLLVIGACIYALNVKFNNF